MKTKIKNQSDILFYSKFLIPYCHYTLKICKLLFTNLDFVQGCTSLISSYSNSGLDWTAVAVALTFVLSLLNLILALILVNNRRERCCDGCSACCTCCWCCVSHIPGEDGGEEAVALQDQQV